MPYIIAVLTLVVVAVGFTLYEPSNTKDQRLTSASPTLTELKDVVSTELSEAHPSTTPHQEAELVMIETDTEPVTTPEPMVIENELSVSNTPIRTSVQNPTPEQTPSSSPEPTPAPSPTPTPTPAPTVPANTFANGTYTTSVDYRVPSHNYTMGVSVTITDDMITAVNVTYDSRTAKDSYTRRFDKAYASYVVGEALDGIQTSRIGGASLTTKAFNKALDTIEAQAAV
ncbi:hypothetical protein H6778_03535 [Candidatus Nomurabacteria bacterium]|nr:hypothetical protein [Candidatus Nomurabacteria bacterium]